MQGGLFMYKSTVWPTALTEWIQSCVALSIYAGKAFNTARPTCMIKTLTKMNRRNFFNTVVCDNVEEAVWLVCHVWEVRCRKSHLWSLTCGIYRIPVYCNRWGGWGGVAQSRKLQLWKVNTSRYLMHRMRTTASNILVQSGYLSRFGTLTKKGHILEHKNLFIVYL